MTGGAYHVADDPAAAGAALGAASRSADRDFPGGGSSGTGGRRLTGPGASRMTEGPPFGGPSCTGSIWHARRDSNPQPTGLEIRTECPRPFAIVRAYLVGHLAVRLLSVRGWWRTMALGQ